jgi:hypothetical protein
MMVERSFALFARHAGHALAAASMARRVYAAPRSGTLPTRADVAGLCTARVLPESVFVNS